MTLGVVAIESHKVKNFFQTFLVKIKYCYTYPRVKRTAQACGRIALMVSTISHGCCSIVSGRADDNECDQLSTGDGILTVHCVCIIILLF